MQIKSLFTGSGLKKVLFTALFVIILIIAGSVYYNYFFTYSEGYRAGLLQKFSYKGTIFKTYEGEMILSSVQSNKNVAIASEKFIFSVAEKEVAQRLDTLQGRNVILHYKAKNGTLPWRGNSLYIVDSAKVIK
ncbi:MAG: hypothetical protein IPH57_01785 [Saprospiraceae bacterium]|nr:hypothetical protein [Saprospiraceae bacterium]